MIKLPKFLLFGQNDPNVDTSIQPKLTLRRWSDLSDQEKQIALREINNNGWLNSYSGELLQTIEYLNHVFLRQCPGKNLHAIKPERDHRSSYGNDSERRDAALSDFQHIFLHEKSDPMIFRMLSRYAACYIDEYNYVRASRTDDEIEKEKLIDEAFEKFDRFAGCLNHIFEQFAVNQVVTRNGFVPRQDQKITDEIYTPTLLVLSDPKWKSVSDDLAKMFEDFRAENYPETITKAHGAVQRFLQIIAGDEGKNSKGEVGKLFKVAKEKGLIPNNRFTIPFLNVVQEFIVSERANNSTAKPTLQDATSSDALLMMNAVMIFLQHCLQKIR